MAKPMLVTLPFVLLLLDYWPLDRLAPAPPATGKRGKAARASSRPFREQALGLVREKVPLFILAAASCVATLVAQKKAMAPLVLTPYGRVANALVAYVLYLGKMLWPLHLAVFYPHPGNSLALWQIVGSGLLLAGATYLVVKKGREYPYLPVGWFWYLGTLVPVIGLVQVGEQALADRYTYLPLDRHFYYPGLGRRGPHRGLAAAEGGTGPGRGAVAFPPLGLNLGADVLLAEYPITL